jgi:hypothetical protein
MGQEERASVERPIAAGHLQDVVSLGTKGGEKTTNGSSYSFRLTFGEERLRTQVSMGDTYSARDTYPYPDVYDPLTPYHLNGTSTQKVSGSNHATITHFP